MRRRAVLGGLAAALASAVPALAAPTLYRTQWGGIAQTHLWLKLAGIGEEAHVRFRTDDGRLLEDGVRSLSWTFRDWRDHDAAVWIDYRLFDVLAFIQTAASLETGAPAPLVVNSAYRTPRRNRTIEGAARHSQHIVGRAADLATPDLDVAELARLADNAGAAGVGRYRRFVHVDVGREGRRWGS